MLPFLNPTQQRILVLGSVENTLNNLIQQLHLTNAIRQYFVSCYDGKKIDASFPELTQSFDLVLFLPHSTTALFPKNEGLETIIHNTPTIVLVDNLSASEVSRLIRGGVKAVIETHKIEEIQSMIDEILLSANKASDCAIYRSVIDQIPLMACLYDKDFTLTYVNENFAALHQRSYHELIGANLLNLVSEDRRQQFEEKMRDLSQENPFMRSEQQNLLPGDSQNWYEFINGVIYDESGEFLTHIGIATDITERTLAYQDIDLLGKTVRHQHSHITAILDTMQEAILSVSLPDQDILYSSRSFEELYGYPLQKFIDNPRFFETIVHPDDLQMVIEARQRCLLDGFAEADHRIVLPDSSIRWVRRRAWLNYDVKGNPISVVDSGRNVTNEKFIEQELKDSEQQYRLTLSNISDAVFITDDNGNFTFICPNVPLLLGYSKEEIRDMKHISAVLGSLEYDADNLEQQGEISNIEWQITTKSGEVRDTLINVKRIQINNGTTLYTVHDVTELKRIESDREQQQQRLNAYFNNTAQGILIADKNAKIVEVNQKLAEIFGYTIEELRGQHIDIIIPLEYHKRHGKEFQEFLEKPYTISFEHRDSLNGVGKDGHIIPLEIAIVPLLSQGEVMALVTDISLRKEAQQILKKSNEELEQHVHERTEELERVKNQIETIFNNSGDGIIVLDTDIRIRQSNAACEWLLSIPSDELYNRKLFELIHRDDIPFVIEALSETQLNGNVARLDTRFKSRMGYIHTEVSISPVIEPSHKTRNFVCIIRDISERKQAQELLETRERLLQTLANNYPAYLAIIDQDFIVRYAAGNDFKKRNINPSHYIGKPVTELVGNQGEIFIQKMMQTFLGEETTFESMLSDMHYLYHTVPLPYKDGIISRILVVGENITDRKQAELAIKESEERYRVLAENVTDMISRHTPEGTFAYVTPSALGITGYTADELIGHSSYAFIHPEDAIEVRNTHTDALTNLNVFTTQYRFERKDKTYVWVESTSHTVRNDANEVIEIVVVTRDITERKQAQEALENALAREKELGELKSRIVSIASHEFRTPLTAILATTETLTRLRSRLDDEKIDQRLQKIVDQVNHMRGITQDMLDFTRLQAQEFSLALTQNNIVNLCQEVVEVFNNHEQFKNRVRFTHHVSTTEFTFDSERIRQVLNNIIDNALKYSESYTHVAVELMEDEENIIFRITDSGIGIPEDDRKHLFSTFFRASNVGTISGTGLGLSLSKQIVELHGGEITVTNNHNKGSIFKIVLPKMGIKESKYDEDTSH